MKKKPITVEDLWKIERPGQPTLSPDGAQACASVTAYDMKENKGRSSLWILSSFGGEPRRLTSAGAKDAEPAWSSARTVGNAMGSVNCAGSREDERQHVPVGRSADS